MFNKTTCITVYEQNADSKRSIFSNYTRSRFVALAGNIQTTPISRRSRNRRRVVALRDWLWLRQLPCCFRGTPWRTWRPYIGLPAVQWLLAHLETYRSRLQQRWQRLLRISCVCSASLQDKMARISAAMKSRSCSLSTFSTTSLTTRYDCVVKTTICCTSV